MKKFFSLSLLSILLINIHAHSQTELSGNITSDSVLTEGSQYVLTGNLTIKSNATLSIQKNVVIDMGSYRITVGSSTPGILLAEEASFTTPGSYDREIRFQDGGSGNINKCNLTQVAIVILNDAADDISLTNNNFIDVVFPLRTHPARIPGFTGNSSAHEIIGIEGTLEENVSLEIMQ